MALSVAILGAGNMAYHLSTAFVNAGVELVQVYNRSTTGLRDIKRVTSVDTINELAMVTKNADIYLIAVSDDAISEVARSLSGHIPADSVVAHTSGSTSTDSLAPHYRFAGAFYPLQSLRRERAVSFTEVPIFISSDEDIVIAQLTKLALTISQRPITIPDKDRSLLHVPAVIVNNFVNHLYTLAADFCEREGLSFEHLAPLMAETLDRIKDGRHPKTLQTGPAIRQDIKTLRRHREMIKEHDQLYKIYNYLTKHIQDYYK